MNNDELIHFLNSLHEEMLQKEYKGLRKLIKQDDSGIFAAIIETAWNHGITDDALIEFMSELFIRWLKNQEEKEVITE